MSQQFFIPAPRAKKAVKDKRGFGMYVNAEGRRLKWSANFPLPAIGERIVATLNGIGPSIVKGYFEEAGFLGVMAVPDSPPEYLQRQLEETRKKAEQGENIPEWALSGVHCFFGAEIRRERA